MATRHGHSRRLVPRSRTYLAWQYMRSRCLNPNNKDFHSYGGRGISICPQWLGDFKNFLVDMGECALDKTLDRLDPNGNYEPGNCRWATQHEQSNNKRSTLFVEHDGRTQTTSEWAAELGVNHGTLKSRVLAWGAERAFAVPFVRTTSKESRPGNCMLCDKAFETVRTHKRFCGQNCRAIFNWRKKNGGLKGKLSPERRHEIAMKGARTRWLKAQSEGQRLWRERLSNKEQSGVLSQADPDS